MTHRYDDYDDEYTYEDYTDDVEYPREHLTRKQAVEQRRREQREYEEELRFEQMERRRRRQYERMDRRYRKREKAIRREERRMRRSGLRRLIVILVVLALIFGGIAWSLLQVLDRFSHLELSDLQTYHDSGHYTNIALFGLDSRDGELDGGVRSDTIIIVSINDLTKDVKLCSVYRDTYLQMSDGSYAKVNAAYAKGPENAVNVLNKNLDLDIEDFAAVNFNALIDTVDILGGIDVEMTSEEAYWTDMHSYETAEVHGVEPTLLPDEDGGTYHLNGVQATAFARIRYTAGDDFKRTERQRLVLSKIIEKAKHASPRALYRIVEQVFPQVLTSLSKADMLKLALGVLRYDMADTTGFPFELEASWYTPEGQEAVVPVGLSQNVTELHQYLFDDDGYTPGEQVQAINDDLIWLTGIDPAYY